MPSQHIKNFQNACKSACRFMGAALLLVSFGVVAQTQTTTIESEQSKLIRAPTAVATYGPGLFGDKVNIYNGALEFVQTDVSLPGNSKLLVAAGRRLVTGATGNDGQGLFATWDLDMPRIHGTFSTVNGWAGRDSAGNPTNSRCTYFGSPPPYTRSGTNHQFRAIEFWHGNMLYVPDAGEQEILRRDAANTNIPSDGVATPLVTKGLWSLRCLPTLASTNGSTPLNDGGEGFLAISPDGTQYRFDWLVTRTVPSLSKPVNFWPSGGAPASAIAEASASEGPPQQAGPGSALPPPSPAGEGVQMFSMTRTEVSILPTLITDRYGNTVRYTYDTADKWKVLTIKGANSAGVVERTLTFTYFAGSHRVKTVSDGIRTWTYGYGVGPTNLTMLTTVTLPDNSAWNFTGMDAPDNTGMIWMHIDYAGISEDMQCDAQPVGLNSPVVTGTMVHPSGATGSFTMTPTQHARNGVQQFCYTDDPTAPGRPYQSQWYDMYSITRKQISGPGLPTLTWDTVYDTFNPGFADCLPACAVPNIVSVTNPNGEVTRYSFGSTYAVDEGMLKQTDVGWNGSSGLRTTTTRYSYAFADLIGVSDQVRGDDKTTTRHIPQDRRVIAQQGVDFVWEVPSSSNFDNYRRPRLVTKSSSLGSKTESIEYYDHTSKWILGQLASVTELGTGKVPVLNGYNPTTGNLETITNFGRRDATMTWYSDGTLATRKDGLNQTTGYTNYKLGIPRTTTYSDAKTETYVVNNIGQITSRTDQNNFTTGYGYDAMGRISSVTPPAGDPVSWNVTSIVFQQVPTTEYSLAPGHWRQTITTGNGRTLNYFDALWRPIYTYKSDLTNDSATSSIVKNDYDFNGNVLFTSYPQRTYANIAGGVHHSYDALGRRTVTGTESELGMIWSGNYYGGGFTTTSTTGRGIDTVFSYQAFDEPTDSAISTVVAPLGVTVNIARDVFTKPTSITRSGSGKSLTRTYVYDSAQRLCKTIEPETGATVQDYDLANNVAWRATGLALPSPSACDTASVPASKKVSYVYDSLNRLKTTSYGDLSPSISRTYTPDGLPLTVNSDGANWTYGYNRRRLNTTETLVFGGTNYVLTKTYDANGSMSQLKYPDNTSVSLSPNALGMPTAVGTYAVAVNYYPNGAISSFNYGNGIAHTLTQSVRGLPDRTIDAGVMNDVYAFDQNGNVTSILDWQEGISNRAMEYDNLDRLTRTYGPAMWGDATFGYDALDNLTTSTITAGTGARTMTHNYPDPSTNRLMSISGTAGFSFAYTYDAQGNIVQRGGQAYVFDQGNRMRQAPGKGTYTYDGMGRRSSVVGIDGITRLQMYSMDGKLVYAGPTTSTKTKYIYLHNHVIAEVGGAGTQYIHTDVLGSPVARTNTIKGIISRTRYEPYGRTAMGAEPTIGFTGHWNDLETGLTYMQQRYYDPVAGRMLSIDPVTTDTNTGGGFNRYVYANNSPYKYIDPDGRQAADRFVEQHRKDLATGNGKVYEPLQPIAVGVTAGMMVIPVAIAVASGSTAIAASGVALKIAGVAGKVEGPVAKELS